MNEISRRWSGGSTRVALCAIAVGAVLACGGSREQKEAAGGPGGLSVEEANTLGQKCKQLVDEATSYHVPNQLPEYWGAACIENFIAKQSVSAVVAAGQDKGITVTDADAREYLKGHADACAKNVENAKALFSGSPVVDGAPEGFMALIDEMVAQLRLQKPVADSSIGPVMLDCKVADVGGGGGTSTGTSPTPVAPTDEQMAITIADAVIRAATFLWNRDLNPLSQASFTASGNCLLTGGYTATGTRTFVPKGCSGTGSIDVRYDMTSCEHESYLDGVSVVFTGSVRDQGSSSYEGSCSDAKAQTTTMTGTDLTVVYKRAAGAKGGAFEKTFEGCDIELNYDFHEGQKSTTAGRVCGVAVSY